MTSLYIVRCARYKRVLPIYNMLQRLHSKSVTLSKINGVAIKAANTPAVRTNTMLYLITCSMLQVSVYGKCGKTLTIKRRCLFCLTENSGAWIWLEGRNQTKQRISFKGGKGVYRANSQSSIECILSA